MSTIYKAIAPSTLFQEVGRIFNSNFRRQRVKLGVSVGFLTFTFFFSNFKEESSEATWAYFSMSVLPVSGVSKSYIWIIFPLLSCTKTLQHDWKSCVRNQVMFLLLFSSNVNNSWCQFSFLACDILYWKYFLISFHHRCYLRRRISVVILDFSWVHCFEMHSKRRIYFSLSVDLYLYLGKTIHEIN